MKGQGRGASAVSFLNALFDGTGSAAGIELFAHAEVELLPTARTPEPSTLPFRGLPLVEATAAAAVRAWSPEPCTARVRLRSEIPPSCGLKSSSAVATAVEHAVLDALGRSADATEVARLGAEVARAGGFSATGAFDDALASVEPGIHVTDNLGLRRLRHRPAPEDLEVVLWVPDRRHRPSPELRGQFAERRTDAGPARQAALDGDWPNAMGLNSELVEAVMGYDYAPLRTSAARVGATGSGVSGLGPAFAVVTPADHLAEVLRSLPAGTGQVIVTRFLRRPTGEPR